MRRVAAVAALVLAVASPAVADDVEVADLVDDGGAFQGVVTVEGELVGDFQRRGAWVWTQLNGDSYADTPAPDGGRLTGSNVGIAVRFPSAEFDAAGFDRPGGYGVRGSIVRVTGEWRFHDEARGGESYLTSDSFEVLERERRFEESMPWGVLMAGLVALALGGAIAWFGRRRGS
jgi:opacity protein-like surface antigen